ncbi:MAG: VOC family protein [Roseobacter sp.]
MAKSIDHYILLTDDLPAARDQYLKLGFNVLPIEKHIEFGSANAVVIFPNSYLELLDLGNSPPVLRDAYAPRLSAGPGLCHVSLTAQSLRAEAIRLAGHGYTADPPLNARRKVVMPDGSQAETDSSSMYNWRSERPYLSLFFSEHRKPETIFIEGHNVHENGVLDTVRIVSASVDPDADLTYYEASADGQAVRNGQGGFQLIGFRGDVIEVLSPEAICARYRPLIDDLKLGDLGGFPVALHYSVSDIVATRAYLSAAEVGFTEQDAHLILSRESAMGCLIVFEPANPRLIKGRDA